MYGVLGISVSTSYRCSPFTDADVVAVSLLCRQ